MERTQMIPVCTVVESLAGRDKGHFMLLSAVWLIPTYGLLTVESTTWISRKKRIAGISGYWERAYPLEALVPRESAMNGYGPS